MFIRNAVGVCAVLDLLVVIAEGNIQLSTSKIAVVLSSERCWTPLSICRQGSQFCSYSGSGQGTVICEGGAWAGSVHFNEQLQEAHVRIGDMEVPLVDGSLYEGDDVLFERVTFLGETFHLRSLLEVHGDAIVETVTLERTDSPATVAIAYGFLGSRCNRLIEYAAFDRLGNRLSSGTTVLDDNGFQHVTGAVATAQFDPNAGEGVLSCVLQGAEYGLQQFIWDRPYDNKLYCRFTGMEGVLPAGSTFTIVQEVRFFDSSGTEWASAAGDLMGLIESDFDRNGATDIADIDLLWDALGAAVTPATRRYDVSGDSVISLDDAQQVVEQMIGTSMADTNLDGCVNLLDLGNLANLFNHSGSLTFGDGDTDADGDVDILDLGNLADDYGKVFYPVRLPEPGALLLLMCAGIRVVWLRRSS